MRAIDADALMDLYANRMGILAENYGIDSTACGTLSGAMKLLQIQPTIEPERKKGKWIDSNRCNMPYMCDQCGRSEFTVSNFCPNCGADMRGGET